MNNFESRLNSEQNYHEFINALEQRQNSYDLKNEHESMDYHKIARIRLFAYKFMYYCTEEDKAYLLKNMSIKHYIQGKKIYHRDAKCNELIFIIRGTVQMGWDTPDGKHFIHKFIPSGLLLNIIYFFSKTAYEHDYIAHEATTLAVIPGEVFKTILQRNSQVLYHVFELVCKRNRLLDNDIYHHSTRTTREQLARHFLYLLEYFSSQMQDCIKISIRLSQENLAELLKTSRQSIRKEINWFVEQGIIETKYNQIFILDKNKLIHMV